MKSSIMYLYIKENDLQNAEKYYLNIKKEDPSFLLDDFKLLDYCSLLIKNNQLITAIDILEKTARKKLAKFYFSLIQYKSRKIYRFSIIICTELKVDFLLK